MTIISVIVYYSPGCLVFVSGFVVRREHLHVNNTMIFSVIRERCVIVISAIDDGDNNNDSVYNMNSAIHCNNDYTVLTLFTSVVVFFSSWRKRIHKYDLDVEHPRTIRALTSYVLGGWYSFIHLPRTTILFVAEGTSSSSLSLAKCTKQL